MTPSTLLQASDVKTVSSPRVIYCSPRGARKNAMNWNFAGLFGIPYTSNHCTALSPTRVRLEERYHAWKRLLILNYHWRNRINFSMESDQTFSKHGSNMFDERIWLYFRYYFGRRWLRFVNEHLHKYCFLFLISENVLVITLTLCRSLSSLQPFFRSSGLKSQSHISYWMLYLFNCRKVSPPNILDRKCGLLMIFIHPKWQKVVYQICQ